MRSSTFIRLPWLLLALLLFSLAGGGCAVKKEAAVQALGVGGYFVRQDGSV